MIGEELRESVLKWAKLKKEPFFTADVFENIEEAETLKEASDSLRKLFLSGDLARKKVDNVRYIYIVSEIAPFDFEKCFPGSDKNSSETAQSFDGIKPEAADEKTVSKQKRKLARKESKPITQEEPAELAAPASIEFSTNTKETALQGLKPIEIPEGFTLKLKTPGGLMITITSGNTQV